MKKVTKMDRIEFEAEQDLFERAEKLYSSASKELLDEIEKITQRILSTAGKHKVNHHEIVQIIKDDFIANY